MCVSTGIQNIENHAENHEDLFYLCIQPSLQLAAQSQTENSLQPFNYFNAIKTNIVSEPKAETSVISEMQYYLVGDSSAMDSWFDKQNESPQHYCLSQPRIKVNSISHLNLNWSSTIRTDRISAALLLRNSF